MRSLDGIVTLRGHMVRRSPTAAELDARDGLTLTARDVDILVEVHRHGLLTAELIELAFYPAAEGERRSLSSCARERLRRLWLWGYLERIEPPVARALGGRPPYLYTLGPRGVGPVAARLGRGAAPGRRRRVGRVDDVFVEHDLTVAAFWAHLKALVRSTDVRELRWVSERELRARHRKVKD